MVRTGPLPVFALALLATLAACRAPATGLPVPDPLLRTPPDALSTECAARRRQLAATLGEGVVVVAAAPAAEGRFFQSDDFLYLAGVEIPAIAFALRVGAQGEVLDEVLFLPPHDPEHEVWSGPRLAPGPQAERATGFLRTADLQEAGALLSGWGAAPLHVAGDPPQGLLPALAAVEREPLRRALDAQRLIKSPHEIACLRNAIDITCRALHEAFAVIEPDAHEYVAQAAIEGTFLRLGSERPGFPSIVGSGPNSVTLHYDANRRQMRHGELVVMDVGAKWRGYCADVTRTVPVNGRFTTRQREVYQVVLDAQSAAAQAARPGMTLADLDAIARAVITERGFGPGRRYFKHGVGHWIGLHVHDVGGRLPIEPGALFTIEPGIYIAEEALGVRIEDCYLMTETGAVKLSTGVPSEADAIERLMTRG